MIASSVCGIVSCWRAIRSAERFGLAGLAAVVVRFILAWVLADLGEFVEAFTANDLHW